MAVIGITSTASRNGKFEGREVEYIDNVLRFGCMPFLIPPRGDASVADRLMKRVDGLLIGGGPSLDSTLSSTPDNSRIGIDEGGPADISRDIFECQLLYAAWDNNIPILGICRGMQLMNVAFGGTLIPDLTEVRIYGHEAAPGAAFRAEHLVEMYPDTLLRKIYESDMGKSLIDAPLTISAQDVSAFMRVNSMHHQGVDELAQDFAIGARSLDGLPEEIEAPSKAFALGVQWHPEYLENGSPLFESFCNAAKAHAQEGAALFDDENDESRK